MSLSSIKLQRRTHRQPHQTLLVSATFHTRPAPQQPEDFATGYAYAIRTASATVLVTLQRRCQQAGGRDVATRCQFVM